MAKKKVENIVIKDEELVPTTIGVYSNKTKSPVGLFIIIGLFLAIAIFMPDIQSYVNKMLGNEEVTNNGVVDSENTKESNDDNKEEDVIEKYTLSSETIVDEETYKINNILLSEGKLSFTITNKLNDSLKLDDYYVELYSESNTLLERLKVSENSIEANSNINIELAVSSSQPSTFSFVEKSEKDYPIVKLNYDDNSEARLTCKQGNSTYIYTFIDDELTKIDQTYQTTDLLDSNVSLYQSRAQVLNLEEGITASSMGSVNGFTYNMSADLKLVEDISKINDVNIYKYKTNVKEIKFKEESRKFNCTI